MMETASSGRSGERASDGRRAAAGSPTAGAAGSRPIAAAVLAALRRPAGRKVIRLADFVEGRARADHLARTMATPEDLADLHPAHAAYTSVQNLVSVLSETLTQMREMAPFVDLIGPAEDRYLPDGPPMSPLTRSFFTCWAFFDARVGPAGETIGTTILEAADLVRLSDDHRRLIRAMQDSRMGVFVHEGVAGDDRGHPVANLRELWTGVQCRALASAGYAGEPGELWYARVLPPPFPGRSPPVVFTTPHVLRRPGALDWRACFRRSLPGPPEGEGLAAYEAHMKYGPTPSYWNDFVFEAYAGHRREAVFLEGLPDDPGSRPCSRVNDWRCRP